MVTSFFFEYFETAMPRPGVMAGRWMTFPSISAPGTRPNPALPTMTDSAGLPTRLPVEVQEWSNGISPLTSSVFGSSDSKSSTPGG